MKRSSDGCSVSQLLDKARQIGSQQIRQELSGLVKFLLQQERRINVLEIGSAEGGTFYLWCKLFSGKKISLDCPGKSVGGIGMPAARKRNREFRKWSNNVYSILANSHSMLAYHRLKEILSGEKLDFLFIDGDHTLPGVQLDYFMYREFVRPGGHIAFHDINDTRWHTTVGCLVGRFWARLKGEKQEFNSHRYWGGIGVLKVPG